MSKKILITGSAGFVGGYVVDELLKNGWDVVGVDNYSTYGPREKSYDRHPNYLFYREDVKNTNTIKEIASECDYILAGAAMVGGISYAHKFSYDLLSENEKIIISTFDAAIDSFKNHSLKKIIVISSSMVFESTSEYPTPEGAQLTSPPPRTTYGFQKLSCEYFARGANEQYGLPYSIVRPFNCVGIGEQKAITDKEILSGDIKLVMSHVVPDLIQKIIKGQDPLHILGSGNQVRHYTAGVDLARGIRMVIENPKAENEDFNLSTSISTTVLELSRLIWKKINPEKPFRYISDEPFSYDVQRNIPDTRKAKEILDFDAKITLDEILDEIIPWVSNQIYLGNI